MSQTLENISKFNQHLNLQKLFRFLKLFCSDISASFDNIELILNNSVKAHMKKNNII